MANFQETLFGIENNILDTIQLDKNTTWSEVEQLLAALKTNTSVKTLNLSHQFLLKTIARAGAKQIEEMLEVNKSLEQLILIGHQIGSQGVIAIANAAAKHPTLKELDLSQCDLDCFGFNPYDYGPAKENATDALNALAAAINQSATLEKISVQGCSVSGTHKLDVDAEITKEKNDVESLSRVLKFTPPVAAANTDFPITAARDLMYNNNNNNSILNTQEDSGNNYNNNNVVPKSSKEKEKGKKKCIVM